ncbi:hypothetical protein BDV93DRAFT_595964 [Ceratobasidium sp. AG-I]|nr:hypothetical protein BDV93DRAFT_595964 [Ceratobasidium sp. AG-I]
MFSLSSPPPASDSKASSSSSKGTLDTPKVTDEGDGSSDSCPIRLSAGGYSGPGVTNQEMEAIGKVVYKSSFELLSSLSVSDALAILHIATKFLFDSLRPKVLSTLDSATLDPWQQYTIAVDHGIEEWLLPSYINICGLIEPPSPKGAQEFNRRKDLDDYVRISAIREDYRTRLILYAFAPSQIHPYTSSTTDSNPSIFVGCERSGTCRPLIKAVLTALFNNGPDYHKITVFKGDPPKTIHDLVLQATRLNAEPTTYRMCNTCCGKDGRLIADALGQRQLEAELKKLLHMMLKRKSLGSDLRLGVRSDPGSFKRVKSTPGVTPGAASGSELPIISQSPSPSSSPRESTPLSLPSAAPVPSVPDNDYSSVKRHPKYYLEDGNVVFLTSDDTLFRLHKSILMLHSTFFENMFRRTRPRPRVEVVASMPVDRTSEMPIPIQLDGQGQVSVNDKEFELICGVLYGMPLTSSSELGTESTLVLLQVCNKLQFKTIKDKMTQILEATDILPWDRYFLGVDHRVDSWTLQGCLEISGSVESYPPALLAKFASRNETARLSKILQIRQEYRSKLVLYSRGRARHPYPVEKGDISPVCGDCLTELKSILTKALSPEEQAKTSRANSSKYPVFRDYLLKAFRPDSQNPSTICVDCRGKEAVILERALGLNELSWAVEKGMSLVRSLHVLMWDEDAPSAKSARGLHDDYFEHCIAKDERELS